MLKNRKNNKFTTRLERTFSFFVRRKKRRATTLKAGARLSAFQVVAPEDG